MPEKDLLNQVRAASREVAERARYVRIDLDRISDYAASLPLAEARAPQLDPRYHYSGAEDDVLAFVLTLDAVNFGSGYFPKVRKRGTLSGYFTMASALKDHFEAEGPMTAQELSALTAANCAAIFGQEPDAGAVSELMQLYASALNDLGRYLSRRFGGRFAALVEQAHGSAERLVEILIEMPFFKDVKRYGDLEVPFYKRAQITAADLSTAFDGQGLGHFRDLERLTMFADNLVPHVLRVDGLLQYEESLATRIAGEELIPSGSLEEVEIRATAVHTVELLVGEPRMAGEHVSASGLDYLLWNRGQQPAYKARPRHRTRSVFY